MSSATDTVDNAMTDHTASFAHSSRLLIALCASALLHAVVIGLWPEAAGTASSDLPAATVAVRLQHESAAQQTAPATATPTAMANAEPVVRKPVVAETNLQPKRTRTADTQSKNSNTSATPTRSVSRSGTATNTSTARETSAALRQRINGRLQHALLAHFDYPPVARRRGWEGVVQVSVRVEANGQLSQLRLVASSGFALLDRAAMKSLGDIQRLTDAAGWLQGEQIDMIFPIRYQLIDS